MNSTLQELKERNKHLLIKFEIIYKIKDVMKNGLILIYVRNGKLDCLYTISELRNLTGIAENEFHLLKGSLIAPIFYEVEEIHNSWGRPVFGETTVKELNLRMVNPIT